MENKCQICGAPTKYAKSKKCRSCYLETVEKGEESKKWTGGKPRCTHCNKLLSDYTSKVCRKCYAEKSIGSTNPNWRGGIPKCIDCGKKLSDYVSVRCKKCKGDSQQGELNPNWIGGRVKKDGYIYLYKPNHPNSNKQGYIFEHRYVVSEIIGRPLTNEDVIHHINHISDDNRIDNLMLTTKKEHRQQHLGSRVWTEKQIVDMVQYYMNGESSIKVSKRYNCTPQAVIYWLKKTYGKDYKTFRLRISQPVRRISPR